MIYLTATLLSSRPHLHLNPRKKPLLVNPIITTPSHPCLNPPKTQKRRGCRESGLCRVEFSHDAPFAAAVGACMLTSLVFAPAKVRDDESQAALNTTDARFSVMGIIYFIPSIGCWVFAWLDSGNRRYTVYAVVYLAPYLRSNLFLSPEDSWLPIASIIFGISHVQLEASIRNGDIQGLQLFSEAVKHFKPISWKKDVYYDDEDHEEEASEESRKSCAELRSGKQEARDEV